MIRICVMVDLATDDPSVAYTLLRGLMAGRLDWNTTHTLGWETSSEWYTEDGALIPAGEVSNAMEDYYSL